MCFYSNIFVTLFNARASENLLTLKKLFLLSTNTLNIVSVFRGYSRRCFEFFLVSQTLQPSFLNVFLSILESKAFQTNLRATSSSGNRLEFVPRYFKYLTVAISGMASVYFKNQITNLVFASKKSL
jgi:hypothetical protein